MDWEWAKLEDQLDKMMIGLRYAIIKKYWDYEKVKASGGGDDLEAKAFKNFDACMKADNVQLCPEPPQRPTSFGAAICAFFLCKQNKWANYQNSNETTIIGI